MTLIRNNKLPVKHARLIFNERILISRNISKTDAAKYLRMSRKQVSLFANGKTAVSVLLAKKLEAATGISAIFWLNIQMAHDLYIARNEIVVAEPMYPFGCTEVTDVSE